MWHETGKTITQHNRESRAVPPRYEALTLALNYAQRADLWKRIDQRVDAMLEAGLVDEVEGLLSSGVGTGCTSMQAIGYKELAAALSGGGDLTAAVGEVKLRSRQYAKRQLTWFRRGQQTKWIAWEKLPDLKWARQCSAKYLEEFGLL